MMTSLMVSVKCQHDAACRKGFEGLGSEAMAAVCPSCGRENPDEFAF
jgi:hypothetical protein